MSDLLRFPPQQEPPDAVFDVRELIEQACERLEPQMAKSGVNVEVDAPPYMMITADGPALREVLELLISQAIQLTPPHREIVVTVYDEADGLDLEIADGSAIFSRELDEVDPSSISASLDANPQIQTVHRLVAGMAGALDVVECADGAIAFNVHLPRGADAGADSRQAA